MQETKREYPQPYEDVWGVRRTRDDLLNLDPAALMRRLIMMRIACEFYRTTLNFSNTTYGRPGYERMVNPRIGDLVTETVALRRPDEDDEDTDQRLIHGFGILLGERTEWTCSHEVWQREVAEGMYGDQVSDADRATIQAVYVQYGPKPEDIVRWVNCSMIALPTGMLHHTKGAQP